MSKAPKNIEKIVLAVALLIAAGLVALGFMKKNKVEESFSDTTPPPREGDTGVAGAEEVSRIANSLQSDRSWEPATVENTALPSGQRPVDLFAGVPLFVDRDNPNVPVDPVNSPAIHPPIPNIWWLENRVSPNYADSPQRDADGDGFSNLEEWEAKTSPVDSKDTPSLIAKLSYVGDESVDWIVEPGTEITGKWYPKYEDTKGGKNKEDFNGGLEPGGLFFKEDPAKERFKFTGFEDREVFNDRLQINEKLRFALFEDQKENKAGMKYEVPLRMPRAQRRDYIHHDRTAVLELKAAGQEGKEFKVEEYNRFSLPPGGDNETYFLKSVTPDEVIVEFDADGATREVRIPKGGMPAN